MSPLEKELCEGDFRHGHTVDEWLAATGAPRAAHGWEYPPNADRELIAYVFEEYERRDGSPLSVVRGHTGSDGPYFAPRIVEILGRGHPVEYQHRIVEVLLDAVFESHDWLDAFEVTRREFEGGIL